MIRRLGTYATAIFVLIVFAVVAIPVATLVVLSFQTGSRLGEGPFSFSNYQTLFEQSETWIALRNTLIFTAGSSLLAIVVGTLMAWAVTSVNLPGRSILRILPLCVLVLPPLVKDPAWVILFSPNTGLANIALNRVFGVPSDLIDVYTLIGMITAAGLFSAPAAYVIMLAPFEALDSSVVEASRMSGARLHVTLVRILIPIIRPALLSAVTLLVILTASSFETPIVIGQPGGVTTFMSEMYFQMNAPGLGLNVPAAQGCLYLILTSAMVLFYLFATRNERKFVTISGRGHSHELIQAPVLRWLLTLFIILYATLGFFAPLVITVLTSFLPFYTAVNGNPFVNFTLVNYRGLVGQQVLDGIISSAILAAFVALGVVLVSGCLAYISLKSKSRLRRSCEVIGMAPLAIPGLVYSVGLLLAVLSIPGLAPVAYGSWGVMLSAEIVVFLPITMRLISSALIQLQDELIEMSALSGAGAVKTVFAIVMPILRPALFYAAAIMFVLSFRELGTVILVVATNTVLAPQLALNFFVNGGYPAMSALNIVALAPPLFLVILGTALARSRGTRASAPLDLPALDRP